MGCSLENKKMADHTSPCKNTAVTEDVIPLLFSGTSDRGYDLIFMLDGTVNNRVFTWMKNFVRNYASQLPIDSGEYRVGAMTYANTPDGQFQLNQYNFQNEVSNNASLSLLLLLLFVTDHLVNNELLFMHCVAACQFVCTVWSSCRNTEWYRVLC